MADDERLHVSLPKGTELTGNKDTYRIVKILGRGGFGIVYGAYDSKKRRVAVKEYFPTMLSTRVSDTCEIIPNSTDADRVAAFEKQKKRFLEEGRHLEAFLKEPHIVDVLECFEENGTAYIVMEFISGNTLLQALKQVPDKRFSLKEVLKDLSPLIDVLERMHKNKIIHRDISPDNIMYNGPTIKLLDFGAARMVSADGGFTFTNIGKKHYSPPEQFVGSDDDDDLRESKSGMQGAWTDVYALAATIYRAITGERAPHSQNREFVLRQEHRDPLKLPSSFGIEISSEQEKALMKGLELDYRKRYGSVREFFDALKFKEVIDPPPPPPPPPAEVDKRAWIIAACAILAVIFSFSFMKSSEKQLAEVSLSMSEVKQELTKFDYLDRNYGRASSSFYSDIPVLVLDKDGDSKNIPIHWNGVTGADSKYDIDISKSDAITVEWDGEIAEQRCDIKVSPGSEEGAYPVHFSNVKDADAFDVLVIVK